MTTELQLQRHLVNVGGRVFLNTDSKGELWASDRYIAFPVDPTEGPLSALLGTFNLKVGPGCFDVSKRTVKPSDDQPPNFGVVFKTVRGKWVSLERETVGDKAMLLDYPEVKGTMAVFRRPDDVLVTVNAQYLSLLEGLLPDGGRWVQPAAGRKELASLVWAVNREIQGLLMPVRAFAGGRVTRKLPEVAA